MKSRTRNFITAVCLALMLLAGFHLFKYLTQDITIQVENHSEKTIYDLSIGHSGGAIEIDELAPSGKEAFTIKPAGESGLIIRWREENGNEHNCQDLTYFESGYGGYFGLHFSLVFQYDGAYLIEHERKSIRVIDLEKQEQRISE